MKNKHINSIFEMVITHHSFNETKDYYSQNMFKRQTGRHSLTYWGIR